MGPLYNNRRDVLRNWFFRERDARAVSSSPALYRRENSSQDKPRSLFLMRGDLRTYLCCGEAKIESVNPLIWKDFWEK